MTTPTPSRHEAEIATELLRSGLARIDDDLRFLMRCFAEVLEDLGETELLRALPWIGEPEISDEQLPDRLGQAYAIAFQLLNLVEENVAAEVRIARERALGPFAETGLWGAQLQGLRNAGFTQEEIVAALAEIEIEPVLTAHPTEAKRTTVLEQHRHLFALLNVRDAANWSPGQEEANRNEVKLTLERLWRTGEILVTKPDVGSERRHLLYYFGKVFPEVMEELEQRFHYAWRACGLSLSQASLLRLPKLKFGSWAGGDRDGHPFVTPEVTREALQELRAEALAVLDRALDRLAQKLTLSRFVQQPPSGLSERLSARFGNPDTWGEEPWRAFVRSMQRRLPRNGRNATAYRTAQELAGDLQLLFDSLIQVGADRIAAADVLPVIRTVESFGFHLATLDIRQNSHIHELALAQVLNAAGMPGDAFLTWNDHQRYEFLSRELESPRPFLFPDEPLGPEAESVLGSYRVLLEHIKSAGIDGLGALIVSMTRNTADLLTVYVLAREAGLVRNSPEGLICLLPVVPLFETIEDLERSPGIMDAFLRSPVTQRSLRNRVISIEEKVKIGPIPAGKKPFQQIMLGYSDSNKESGILASQWALHRAQIELTRVAAKYECNVKFFHGRGGTISRGAGPTHRFLDALPTCSGVLRVTEQGETIAQKFGHRQTAIYNLELLLAGVASVTVRHRRGSGPLPAEVSQAFDILVSASRTAYQQLLQSSDFMRFYSEATPIDALESSSIGSRPSRRTGQRTLADLRAIPWVFSWTQSRFYLPAWFGVGSALDHLSRTEPGLFQALAKHEGGRPFLRYVFTNVETNLASANIDIMQAYADLVEDPDIRQHYFQWISLEFEKTQRLIGQLYGRPTAQRRPRMLKTLSLRADALQVLHRQQIRLLREWRGFKRDGNEQRANAMLPDLLLSINAIASGLRTTG